MQHYRFLRSIARALAGAAFGVALGILVVALAALKPEARPPVLDVDGPVEQVVRVTHRTWPSATDKNSEAVLREIAFAQVAINDMEGATDTVEGMGEHGVNKNLVWNQIVAMLVVLRFDHDDGRVATARQIAAKIGDDLFRADAMRRIAVAQDELARYGARVAPPLAPPPLQGEALEAPRQSKNDTQSGTIAANDPKMSLREASRLALATRWASPDRNGIVTLLWERLDLLGVLAVVGAFLVWFVKPLAEEVRDALNRRMAKPLGLGAVAQAVSQNADTK